MAQRSLSRKELQRRAQELEALADESERESAEFDERIDELLSRLRAIGRRYQRSA